MTITINASQNVIKATSWCAWQSLPTVGNLLSHHDRGTYALIPAMTTKNDMNLIDTMAFLRPKNNDTISLQISTVVEGSAMFIPHFSFAFTISRSSGVRP